MGGSIEFLRSVHRGAIVPVASYLFSTGTAALIVSVVLSALALLGTALRSPPSLSDTGFLARCACWL